ncbi:MAG TPA: alanine racemase [Candidatus Limnocylindria bacterium]
MTAGGRHRAWLEIDHAALAANLATLRRLAGEQEVIGVVKANAYGHGAVDVARTLLGQGVERLAVATVSEAADLRAAGIQGPLVVLWGIGDEDAAAVVELDLEPMVDRDATVETLAAAAAHAGRRIGVHLKVDTGLGRQGVEPEGALDLARTIGAAPGLVLAGTMTHLAAADDTAYTDRQLDRMASVLDDLRAAGVDPGLVHVAATGAILAGVGTFADAVRPGIGLYGLAPAGMTDAGSDLRPILSLRALPLRVFEVAAGTPVGYGLRWTAARRSRLATLPIGYGDGWPRSHLNNGFALVHGTRVPMVGAISMDGLVVDVSDAGSVGLEDEFVLIGRQGDAVITADEVAAQRETINYEVTTSLRQRLPRRHLRP